MPASAHWPPSWVGVRGAGAVLQIFLRVGDDREAELPGVEREGLATVATALGEEVLMELDDYVVDVLMPDLVGHDRHPSAFLVYLFLSRHAVSLSW
jgi:hypothetical protein